MAAWIYPHLRRNMVRCVHCFVASELTRRAMDHCETREDTKLATGGAAMNRKSMVTIGVATVWLAVLGGLAISAQDKYTVKVPGGLAFSDFKGYENWQFVSMSQTDDRLKAILANPTMIAAYKVGIPGNGKPFPDGSK